MVSNYKVFIFDESQYYNPYIGWRNLGDLENSVLIYCFNIDGKIDYEYKNHLISKIRFKDYVSIYQFKEIEIMISKNKKNIL